MVQCIMHWNLAHLAPLLTLGAVAAAADAAPARVSLRQVFAAAHRCGISGTLFERTGRRAFTVPYREGTTTVTVEEGPISPERERQMEAEANAARRPWNCLQRWARQRRVTIGLEMPPVVIYD